MPTVSLGSICYWSDRVGIPVSAGLRLVVLCLLVLHRRTPQLGILGGQHILRHRETALLPSISCRHFALTQFPDHVRVGLHGCRAIHCCVHAQCRVRLTGQPAGHCNTRLFLRRRRSVQSNPAFLEVLVSIDPSCTNQIRSH